MLCINSFKRLLRPIISAGKQRNIWCTPPEETPTKTTLQVLDDFYICLGVPRNYIASSNLQEQRRRLMEYLPRDRNELPPRRMQDSFVSAIVPLKNNLDLREKYINALGTLRTGRLLEELDVMAGYCCYQHILNPRSQGHPNPYSCVTALVDTIQFSSNNANTDDDLRISGHVSWVGKSSMEVSLLIDQRNNQGKWVKLTEAVFVFVARDPMNQGAAFVNPLITETQEEKDYVLQGEERNKKRRLATSESLIQKPPNREESELIHNLFQRTDEGLIRVQERSSPLNTRRMADCQSNTLLLCHPQSQKDLLVSSKLKQDGKKSSSSSHNNIYFFSFIFLRNRFNKIFGGFIMRQAFEMAHSSAHLYARSKPKIVYIDDILFRKPVEIGSLLNLTANIGYVEGQYIHIPVVAEVLKPETNERSTTNVFQFTFISQGNPPPTILPNTYLEAMVYLDARRHFKEMMAESKRNA